MALDQLTSSDAGAVARAKINTNFGVLDVTRTQLQQLFAVVAGIDPRVGNLEAGLDVAEAVSDNLRVDLTGLTSTVAGINPRVGGLELAQGVNSAISTQLRTDLQALFAVVAGINPRVGNLEAGLTIAEAVSENISIDLSGLTDIVARIDPLVNQLLRAQEVDGASFAQLTSDLDALYKVVACIDPVIPVLQQGAKTAVDEIAILDAASDEHGVRLAALDAAAAALNVSLTAALDRLRSMQRGGRPGTTPDAFSFAASPDRMNALAGPRAALPGIPASMIVASDSGTVAQVFGAGTVGMRHAVAIEPGRLYRPRAVVRRRTDPTDPSGDAVAVVVILLDQSLNFLGTVTVKQFHALKINDGRQSVETTMSRSASTGPLLPVLDGRTRFAVAAAVLYGLDGRTDVEFLDIEDATSSVLLSAPAANYDARIGAIESEGLPSRVSALETEVTAPSSVRYATKGAAAAATIPETAQVVELMGSEASGDGGAGLYARATGATTVNDDTFVSKGVTWRRVDLSDAVMTGILERWWSRRPTTPPDRSGAIWSNGGTWAVTS